jgi:hypothetical protein
MIQALRTVHRLAFVVLAFVLLVVIVAGLAARRPLRASGSPPVHPLASAQLLRRSGTLWPKHAMRTEFYSDSRHPGAVDVVLITSEELGEPDLLLYWSVDPPSGDSLPAGARLMGPFITGKPFVLPPSLSGSEYLVLFSLAHQAVFDTAKVEKQP